MPPPNLHQQKQTQNSKSIACIRKRASSVLSAFVIATLVSAVAPESRADTATLKIKNQYGERLKCGRATNKCKVYKESDYTATFEIPLTESEAAGIGKRTKLAVRLGKLRFDQKLGKKFNAADGTAMIRTNAKNRVGKKVGSRTMNVTVTDDSLICEIRSKVKDLKGAKWKPLLASKSTLRKAGKLKRNLKCQLKIDDRSYSFKVKCKGRVKIAKTRGDDGKRRTLRALAFTGRGSTDANTSPEPMPVVVRAGTDSPAGNGTIGTFGGDISCSGALTGVSIRVPAGAMNDETPIVVASNDIQVSPSSGSFVGTAVNIHTGGQTSFEEPLAVTLPLDGGPEGTVPVPYYINDEGVMVPCQVTSIDRTAGTMTFETFHTSLFAWLWAELTNFGGNTAYLPSDGFQIVNFGSQFNPGGECFGIAAFAQWYYANHGGGLFPKYMQDTPSGAGTVKGQNIIATRAHTSVSWLWNSYIPNLMQTYNLTGSEVYSSITNILDNTARPTVLYLDDSTNPTAPHAAHAVLAYDHVGADELLINDPNHPGSVRRANLAGGKLTYGQYARVSVIGNGSFTTENFSNIYNDAEAGFNGEAAAQVEITSYNDGDDVTDRQIVFSGKVESGSVLVDKITIWLNGTAKFEQSIEEDGLFSIPISLVVGENKMTFETSGILTSGNRTNVLNTQTTPFIINLQSDLAQILVTLSWNTNDTDLDLYVIDPIGAHYTRKNLCVSR